MQFTLFKSFIYRAIQMKFSIEQENIIDLRYVKLH